MEISTNYFMINTEEQEPVFSDWERIRAVVASVREEAAKVIVGQADVVDQMLVSLLCRGHCLIVGVPGLAKTLLVGTLGRILGLDFKRIQFTPDLMPPDILGSEILQTAANGSRAFEYVPGPVFTNLLLADEINRTSTKTQAALLEAMEERRVTVDGKTHPLPQPFFVLATQNPIEQDGTYPLPEAQMDRFMFKLVVPNPSLNELMEIVDMTQKTMEEVADAACTGEELLEMRATANQIPVATEVMRYAMYLTSATHPDSECATETAKKYIRVGASPRAGQALISAAKVKALIKGRFNVAYNDINELAYPVLRHRIKMNFEAIAERVTPDNAIEKILEEIAKTAK